MRPRYDDILGTYRGQRLPYRGIHEHILDTYRGELVKCTQDINDVLGTLPCRG